MDICPLHEAPIWIASSYYFSVHSGHSFQDQWLITRFSSYRYLQLRLLFSLILFTSSTELYFIYNI